MIPIQKSRLTVPGTDINLGANAEEEGTNIKTRNVIKAIIIIIKICQKHNNSIKIHVISNLLSRPHIWTQEISLCKNVEKFT